MAEIPIRSCAVSLVALRETQSTSEILLLRRTGTLAGLWCQVAGGVEENETAWQAAVRELKEETALTPLALYSADICEQFYEVERDMIEILPVFVAIVREDSQVVINHEHSAFRWVSFDQAFEMVSFAGQRNMLRHVQTEFANRAPNPLLKIEID